MDQGPRNEAVCGAMSGRGRNVGGTGKRTCSHGGVGELERLIIVPETPAPMAATLGASGVGGRLVVGDPSTLSAAAMGALTRGAWTPIRSIMGRRLLPP